MTRQPTTVTGDPAGAEAPTLSASELAARLGQPSLVVVDARPMAAYNGWRIGEEARGGHVPGAVAFPVTWLDRVDREEVDRLLREKGVGPGIDVVIVGRDVEEAGQLVPVVTDLGAASVRRLEGGFAAWAEAPDRAIERLPRYERLVHIDWLRELLAGGRPEAAPAGRSLLFHVNFGVPEEYAEGHIPGALYLDTNWLEDPLDWNRRSPAGRIPNTIRSTSRSCSSASWQATRRRSSSPAEC